MSTRPFTLATIAAFSLVAASAPAAQDEAEQTPPPAKDQQDQQQDEGGEGDSLDELLGLEEDASGRSADDAAERETREELEAALREQQKQIDDAFRQALEKMSLSADLLGGKFDPGLGTQRVQEDIIAKLDLLIQAARNQQNNSSSSSSSASRQQSNQQQQPRRQQQNQPQQGENSQQRNQNPADSGSTQSPTEQADRELNELLQEMDVEWGALPERKREQLNQARDDKPSSLYRRLTHEYFKRISDESSR